MGSRAARRGLHHNAAPGVGGGQQRWHCRRPWAQVATKSRPAADFLTTGPPATPRGAVATAPFGTVPGMSPRAPLFFSLQGPRRRVLYVALYEGIAIAVVTLALLVFTDENPFSAGGLAVGSSVIAVAWNLVFNALFERWERRQAVRGRSAARRVAHAIGFEGGLLFWLVPFFAWWLNISLWQALVMDVGLLVFFLVYTFVFTWVFDRVFGLPAAAT